eukprot:scaffold218691_cov19-Tisochrysis_lutea.AAC.1
MLAIAAACRDAPGRRLATAHACSCCRALVSCCRWCCSCCSCCWEAEEGTLYCCCCCCCGGCAATDGGNSVAVVVEGVLGVGAWVAEGCEEMGGRDASCAAVVAAAVTAA